MSTDTLIALLKKNGLKATPQRLAVHEAMTHLGHASADQVAELIKLFQEYEEKDENAPYSPYIEKFAGIMVLN